MAEGEEEGWKEKEARNQRAEGFRGTGRPTYTAPFTLSCTHMHTCVHTGNV